MQMKSDSPKREGRDGLGRSPVQYTVCTSPFNVHKAVLCEEGDRCEYSDIADDTHGFGQGSIVCSACVWIDIVGLLLLVTPGVFDCPDGEVGNNFSVNVPHKAHVKKSVIAH